MATVQCCRFLFDRGILIDYFSIPRKCTKKLTYFLSHLHQDHTQGLRKNWASGPLYCSKGTAELVSIRYGLKVNVLEEFIWYTHEGYRVALLPAHHCYGSSMFVFDFGATIVVYSGDYRLRSKQLSWNWPKRIDWLMLDTTYHKPEWILPSYEDSMRAMNEVIKFTKIIYVHCLGVEEFIIEWAKRYGHGLRFQIEDPMTNHIIAQHSIKSGAILVMDTKISGCVIRPCCQWFILHGVRKPWAFDEKYGIYRVWYSQHASHKDNQKLIYRLKPERISECVIQIEPR